MSQIHQEIDTSSDIARIICNIHEQLITLFLLRNKHGLCTYKDILSILQKIQNTKRSNLVSLVGTLVHSYDTSNLYKPCLYISAKFRISYVFRMPYILCDLFITPFVPVNLPFYFTSNIWKMLWIITHFIGKCLPHTWPQPTYIVYIRLKNERLNSFWWPCSICYQNYVSRRRSPVYIQTMYGAFILAYSYIHP